MMFDSITKRETDRGDSQYATTQRRIPRGEEEISFSESVIRAHGVLEDGSPRIGCQTFITPPERRGGAPFAPVCEPEGDTYLGFLGIGASGRGDIILSLRTLEGLLPYYRSIGLLHPETNVIEVDPLLNGTTPGYPGGDALTMLTRDLTAKAEVCRLLEGRDTPLFVSTFLSEYQREQVSQMGWKTVQSSDPRMTSNKAEFRKDAPLFGFQVADGGTITSMEDMHTAATLVLDTIVRRIGYGDRPGEQGWTGGWMKLAHGSGGDFVQSLGIPQKVITSEYDSIADALAQGQSVRAIVSTLLASHSNSPLGEATHATVNGAYERLRASVVQAFSVNDYGAGALEKFWPATSLSPLPHTSSIVIEQDVRAYGEVVANASNLMMVHHDGTSEILGWFKQLTGPEGDYRGSAPFDPEEIMGVRGHTDLVTQVNGIIDYCHSLGLYGYAGVDFFCVKNSSGDIELFMTELNGRIPISGTAAIMARKLGAPAWININVEASEPITSIADFTRIFGECAFDSPGDFSRARIIPQALRTLQDSQGTILPSGKFKSLVVGPTHEACEALITDLYQRNIII